MNVSALRDKVIIEEDQGTISDGYGNTMTNWVEVASVWAEVRPIRGYEVTIAEKRGQETTHNVKMRYRPGIKKETHRINYKGRIFEIEYIINKDERNIELNLQCKERG
jgi:SPP1 family predicted phage head-tail adaptor